MGLFETKTIGEMIEDFKRALSPIRRVVTRRRRSARGKRAFYEAAKVDRLTNSWTKQIASADAEICNELSTIRARMRDLSRNNDYAARFLNLSKQNIVGADGIQLQAKPIIQRFNGGGGKPGDIDKPAKEIIETAWGRFCKLGNCTVCGTMSMRDADNMTIETTARDGEYLIRMVRGFDNEFGFALQLIEADFLDETLNMNLPNGNFIRMGVEFDRWRRPVAYHILSKHPGDILYSSTEITQRTKHIRIPANEIIHPYIKKRANQTRGVSWMVTPAYRLNMVGGYEEAELVAARVAAAKMGFFKSADGEGYEGEDTTDEDEHEPIMEAEPGTFDKLPTGMDFVKWDPDHPSTAFEAFVLATLRGVASGFNVSYTALTGDLRSVSYSSIRQGALDERDGWRCGQGWLVEHVKQVVYENWLEMAMLTGAVNLPPRKIEKFKNVAWRARGWEWVDPLKEVTANKLAVASGQKSPQMIAAAQGKTLREVLEEIAEARDIAESLNLYIPALYGEADLSPEMLSLIMELDKEGNENAKK